MTRMKFQSGHWRVVRFCCTSGMCFGCHGRGNHGDLNRRELVLQGEGYSETYAKWIASNYQHYNAVAEEMPITVAS